MNALTNPRVEEQKCPHCGGSLGTAYIFDAIPNDLPAGAPLQFFTAPTDFFAAPAVAPTVPAAADDE